MCFRADNKLSQQLAQHYWVFMFESWTMNNEADALWSANKNILFLATHLLKCNFDLLICKNLLKQKYHQNLNRKQSKIDQIFVQYFSYNSPHKTVFQKKKKRLHMPSNSFQQKCHFHGQSCRPARNCLTTKNRVNIFLSRCQSLSIVCTFVKPHGMFVT